MARFDADQAIISRGIDRKKLKVGRYLIKCADCREVVGAYKGDRFQLDFEIVKGRFAAPGTVKAEVVMLKNIEALSGKEEKDKAKKDNGKIKIAIGAFLGEKPEAVTNAVFGKACRLQKVHSEGEQTVVDSESAAPEASSIYGKYAVLESKPHTVKQGKNIGKKTSFYEFSPFKGDESIFEEYDPSTDDVDDLEDEGDSSGDEIVRRTGTTDAPPPPDADEPPPPVEDEPLTKAAKDGWRFNTKSKPGSKWYFKGSEQLKEADLIKKYS
jgi:hypothetical protein